MWFFFFFLDWINAGPGGTESSVYKKPRKPLVIGSHLWLISINCLDSILLMTENGIDSHPVLAKKSMQMEQEVWALGKV